MSRNAARRALRRLCGGPISESAVTEFQRLLEAEAERLKAFMVDSYRNERMARIVNGVAWEPRLSAHHAKGYVPQRVYYEPEASKHDEQAPSSYA